MPLTWGSLSGALLEEAPASSAKPVRPLDSGEASVLACEPVAVTYGAAQFQHVVLARLRLRQFAHSQLSGATGGALMSVPLDSRGQPAL
ncbi:MAG TPA: hypothetical protein VFN61_15435 [Acidimicrobiales bacterium]|nr:hypothetical protein [Acidimicrobiales bacterium]